MTVKELIDALQKLDPNTQVSLCVQGPKDTAFTDDITQVESNGEIVGWAASDNENAWMPDGS